MSAASWLEGLSTSDHWRELLVTRAPQIAVWVLAVALGVQAAIIVTDLAGASRVPAIDEFNPPPAVPSRRVDVAAIVSSHLFGAAQADAPAAVDAANAPQTSMPLVLTGIIAADEPQAGLAIVGQNAGSTKVYAVGDNLPGGARLHSVYSDRVLLERNGRLESLTLPRQSRGGAVAPPPPMAAMPPSESAPPIERMREMIAQEPGLLSDIMRPQPVFAQGRQRGYRVYPGRNRQAFIRLGLRPGDLVVAINGTPLDDPARGEEIFRTLGSSSEARVTVMRNGRQQDLTLNMAQVVQEAEQLVGGNGAAGAGAEPVEDTAPVAPDEPIDTE
ncbi:MAG: type II secretion system protein GspC [Pseudomonadota bacterium]|jgi:general secretion pathway protein C|nr:MAG: type II secretion system protein GspC [Pseudomonadota bacterium]